MILHKNDYLERLKQKAEQAERIFDITTSHHVMIEQDNVSELQKSLNARQTHIDKMQIIEKRLAELQPETEGLDKDGEISALYVHINDLIKKTIEMDKANLQLGNIKKNEYQAEMRKTRESRKGVGAYMTFTAVDSGFDQKR